MPTSNRRRNRNPDHIVVDDLFDEDNNLIEDESTIDYWWRTEPAFSAELVLDWRARERERQYSEPDPLTAHNELMLAIYNNRVNRVLELVRFVSLDTLRAGVRAARAQNSQWIADILISHIVSHPDREWA